MLEWRKIPQEDAATHLEKGKAEDALE